MAMPQTDMNKEMPKRPLPNAHPGQGSGADKNSDESRLRDPENRLDKTDEDSFPASDPPSHTPVVGP
jgi:hypothetical protein